MRFDLEAMMRDAGMGDMFDRQFNPGEARQTLWECADGWLVGYTTSRIVHGPHEGKFAAFAYKPIGKGARSGDAERHVRTYFRTFSTRKSARARAEKMYASHNAKTRQ